MHVYLEHYNLKAKPFDLSPKPDYLWLGEKHQEALATLRYGIVEDLGFLLLTGDVGVGKTALIHRLIRSLDSSTIVAHITDPGLDAIDFFRIMAAQFQIPSDYKSKGEFLVSFENFLFEAHKSQKKILLIVDEAQRLSNKMIDQIRVLSNIELSSEKLINIFLVGQPEFKDMLMADINRPLRQRIAVNYHIDPLNEAETAAYIEHRLQTAGATHQIFESSAIRKVFKYTGGFPRAINIICDHALLTGFSSGVKTIGGDVIIECENELRIEKGIKLKPKVKPKPVAPRPSPADSAPKLETPVRAVRVAPKQLSAPRSRLFPILVGASIALCAFIGYHLLWSQPRRSTNPTSPSAPVEESIVQQEEGENQPPATGNKLEVEELRAAPPNTPLNDGHSYEATAVKTDRNPEDEIAASGNQLEQDAQLFNSTKPQQEVTSQKVEDAVVATVGQEQDAPGIDRKEMVSSAQAAPAPEMPSDGQEAGSGARGPSRALAAMATLSAALENKPGSGNDAVVSSSAIEAKSESAGKVDGTIGDQQLTGAQTQTAPSPSNPPQTIPAKKPASDKSKAGSDAAKSKPKTVSSSTAKNTPKASDKTSKTSEAKTTKASKPAPEKTASGNQKASGGNAAKTANTTKNMALLAAVSGAKPTANATQGTAAGVSKVVPATKASGSDGAAAKVTDTQTVTPVKTGSKPPNKTVVAAKTPAQPDSIQKLDTVSLEERLRRFLEGYCDTYAAKDLDAFAGYFAPGAKENGKSFESLLPKYEKNFKYIDTIQYRIRLKEFAVDDEDTVTLNGDFFLEWLPPDKKWRENSGKITMSLKQSGSTFQVHQLDYHGSRAKIK